MLSYESQQSLYSMESLDSNQSLDSYQVGKCLGQGKTADVYELKINNVKYALKQFNDKHLRFYEKEKQISERINLSQSNNHPNLVQYIGSQQPNSLIFEFCENGEAFNYIQQARGNFDNQLAKFYSYQLSHALYHLHSNDVAHLDIKLENCMFDSDFNIKLGDYGFSQPAKAGQLQRNFIGTHKYMAPEIEYKVEFDGKKADIFALGVVIFILELGFQPIISKAIKEDQLYKYFFQQNKSRFWHKIEQSIGRKLNKEFKDLINKMLDVQANNRIDIEDVINHPYFKFDEINQKNRIQYMNSLKQKIEYSQRNEQIQDIRSNLYN